MKKFQSPIQLCYDEVFAAPIPVGSDAFISGSVIRPRSSSRFYSLGLSGNTFAQLDLVLTLSSEELVLRGHEVISERVLQAENRSAVEPECLPSCYYFSSVCAILREAGFPMEADLISAACGCDAIAGAQALNVHGLLRLFRAQELCQLRFLASYASFSACATCASRFGTPCD